jgi:hypothetical protein
MKNPTALLGICAVLGSLLLTAGCRSVDEGPVAPADPGQKAVIQGTEPAPTPIPQKTVPAGDSPLDHKAPDQPIDQPKG